jgi:copper resistance protein D
MSAVLSDTSLGLVRGVRVPLMLMVCGAVVALHVRVEPSSDRGRDLSRSDPVGAVGRRGHAQVHEVFWGGVHVTADAVHLLAGGAWLGGLLPLFFSLAPDRTRQASNDEPSASCRVFRA